MTRSIHVHDVVSGRYRIERELGRGAMGVVYLAHDLRHGREVALKVLAATAGSASEADRFFDEIRTAARLTHPFILTVHDSGEVEGTLYYVSPYIEGETLRARLERQKRLSADDAIGTATQLLAALAYAHAEGVIHRDIKPENILLDRVGHAYLADFGVARSLALDVRRTLDGSTLGSPLYMSPEQIEARADADGRGDLYSLACVLFEMLAGEPPFGGPTVQALLKQHLEDAPPSLRSRRADIPAHVDRAIQRALAKDPDQRYASAGAFADALLDRDAGSVAVLARARRPRSFIKPAVAVGLLAAASIVALVQRGGRDEDGAGSARALPAPGAPTIARLAVLGPVEPARDGAPDTAPGLVQFLFSTEMARMRGIAVIDPLSVNGTLAAARTGEPYDALARDGISYVVRFGLRSVPVGHAIDYALVETKTGSVLGRGAFTSDDERLADSVRAAAQGLVRTLNEREGITRAADLEPWVPASPRHVEAVRAFLQGAQYEYAGLNGGREDFERALELDSMFVAPRVWLVSTLNTSGDTAAARAQAAWLVHAEPTATPFEHAMIDWARAVVAGDMDAKIRALQVALRYSPGNNILLYNLASTYANTGRWDEAVPPLQTALASGWQSPRLYVMWGVTAVQVGRVDGLRQFLEPATRMSPQSQYLYGLLEALALFDGDSAAAAGYAASFRRRSTPPRAPAYREFVPVYFSLADLAAQRGRTETSISLLMRAADSDPQNPRPKLRLARALAEAGRAEQATAYYRQARATEPDDADLLFEVGAAAAAVGAERDARAYLTRYLARSPEGPDAVRARERLRALDRRPPS